MTQSRYAGFRPWSARLLTLGFASLFALVALAPTSATPPPRTSDIASTGCMGQRVLRVGMTVGDMERSLQFYCGVLGFAKLSDRESFGEETERAVGVFGARIRVCELMLGDEMLELTEFLAPTGRPVPADSRSNDRWFQHIAIIVRDMDAAYAHLRDHRVRHASTGPQRIPDSNAAAAGIRAFYFRDPDDHVLEVLSFPPDKGARKWHTLTDRLFLGIDHTAIVVADTEASLRFYRDRLGMRVAGTSENVGTEQEHLNNVFGARLRITSLRFPGESGADGPAIELLEYLAPRDGRAAPADTRSNDLVHWHVAIRSAGLGELRDPDGHVIRQEAESR